MSMPPPDPAAQHFELGPPADTRPYLDYDPDGLFAFLFAIVIAVVMVGALIGLWLTIGLFWLVFFFGPMVLVALWMLLTGRDGPGGMNTPHRFRT